ncbi:MAG: hypothetical protein IGR76_11740 [Synechococcales cyanobacterium T60_A2020_003]|nr:hypothetical protein [Synechococcales cyanobacterium T60_A2020_003]
MLNVSLGLRNKPWSIHQILEKSLTTHEMTRQDYLYLTSAALQCPVLTQECHQVNQVLDDLRTGRVRLVD